VNDLKNILNGGIVMAKNNKKAKAPNLLSEIFNTKAKIITTCIIGAVVILGAIFLIIQENSYGRLIIKNNTDIDLEFVKTSFVGDEGTVDNGLQTGKIKAGTKLTSVLEPAYLEYTEANLEVAFKLAGYDEMFTDVGYFNQRFTGNINISFNKTKDPDIITIKIKAANGLFQSSTVNCNEEYEIDLKKGIILD
jgi:hypothetical protein